MIEREILGCFLKDNTLINESEIKANQFEAQAHQLLYQSMQKLAYEGKAIDKVTLMAENYDYISQLGGISFITSLESSGNIDNFESYEKQFIDDYKNRESVRLVTDWINQKDKNVSDLIADVQKIDELGATDEVSKDDVLKELIELPYVDAKDAGVPSGLSGLDALTGGFQIGRAHV